MKTPNFHVHSCDFLICMILHKNEDSMLSQHRVPRKLQTTKVKVVGYYSNG